MYVVSTFLANMSKQGHFKRLQKRQVVDLRACLMFAQASIVEKSPLHIRFFSCCLWEFFSYLSNLAKILDDFAIGFDDFLLEIKSQVSPRLLSILKVSSI